MATRPVFENSTQATHWTCPATSDPNRVTHHLTYPSNTCKYCKVSGPDLVARHEDILKSLSPHHCFEAELESAVESITVNAKDGALVGVAWMDEEGQWRLGAPRSARSALVRSKERAEVLLARYTKFYESKGVHGI